MALNKPPPIAQNPIFMCRNPAKLPLFVLSNTKPSFTFAQVMANTFKNQSNPTK